VAELDLSPKEYEALKGDLGFDVQAALFSHAGTGFGFILLPVDIIGPYETHRNINPNSTSTTFSAFLKMIPNSTYPTLTFPALPVIQPY
jgi:hypothetical protein